MSKPSDRPIGMGVHPPLGREEIPDPAAAPVEGDRLMGIRERLRHNARDFEDSEIKPTPPAPAPTTAPVAAPPVTAGAVLPAAALPDQMPLNTLLGPLLDGPVTISQPIVEVEMKFKLPVKESRSGDWVADIAGFRDRLKEYGRRAELRPRARVHEADEYFTAPWMQHDTYLRLRRINSVATATGEQRLTELTWKGPLIGVESKSRPEETVYIDEASGHLGAPMRLLAGIGMTKFAVVNKEREPYVVKHHGQDVTVVIDRVDGIGDFCELEIVTIAAAADGAVAVLQDLARTLGLVEQEQRGYANLAALKGVR